MEFDREVVNSQIDDHSSSQLMQSFCEEDDMLDRKLGLDTVGDGVIAEMTAPQTYFIIQVSKQLVWGKLYL